MPTVFPLLGPPYEISDAQEAELQKLHSPARQARLDEERRNSELTEALLSEAMQARFKKIEDDARNGELQPALDQIDAVYGRALKKELAAENATARVTELQRRNFAEFKKSAEKWELPYLPAAPQMVTLFLSENCDRGIRHVTRLARSISAVHLACNFSDPTKDPLVRGLLRSLRTDKSNQKGR